MNKNQKIVIIVYCALLALCQLERVVDVSNNYKPKLTLLWYAKPSFARVIVPILFLTLVALALITMFKTKTD